MMPMGNLLLTLAVIFASTSALNATIYSATRASYALGRDNMLPNFFANISKRQKTPWVALMATGAILEAINHGMEASLSEALKLEEEKFVELCSTEDGYEGVTAFLEKRQPKFQDR